MKDRIRQIMESQQMSQQEFALKLELSPASLSSIFTGRTNPTNKHAQAIHRAFPKVSINWLMFGEGDMYIESAGSVSSGDRDEHTVGDGSPEFDVEDYDSNSLAFGSTLFDTPVSPQENLHKRRRGEKENEVFKVKNIDIYKREVKEIRVFYDDGTYETFTPSK